MQGGGAVSPDHVLRIRELDFFCAPFMPGAVPDGCLPVLKHPDNVARYVELASRMRPRIVVELGIARGGSTALLNELWSPERLVAFEIDAQPAAILTRYIEDRDASRTVRPHYGVDQSDRATLARLVGEEIGDFAIDVVVDDASHRYAETRSSFETLFPLVRTGGLFIIEDWNVDQLIADAVDHQHDPASPHHTTVLDDGAETDTASPRFVPLTQLAVELMLVRASSGDVVREVTFNENWAVIERGSEPLHADGFQLSDHVRDRHFGLR